MKKILALVVLLSSLFALVACQSAVSNTKVRVVGLSYSSTETTLATTPSNNSMRLLSNKLVADEVEEYIFPGDILTFTVELEDPNYEFISLLSIKFNDQIIRANVDNSIVTTRDCGVNICVDFPFEITARITEYSVQEVRFAKLNSENGVNAIIDNQSTKTVQVDVYTEEIFPFVLESVQTLNNAVANARYFENGSILTDADDPQLSMQEHRYFKILDHHYSSLPLYSDRLITTNAAYQTPISAVEYDLFEYIKENEFNEQQTFEFQQMIYISHTIGTFEPDVSAMTLQYHFYENEYADIYFYNEGNLIYVNILGNSFLVIEIVNNMRILPA